jgi:pyruvate,orthophosphate dikinase
MCDVEFTISSGRLYVLQTRVGRRSPLAAVRIAVEMAEDPDFPLDRAEAVARIDQDTLFRVNEQAGVSDGATPLGQGLAASPGVGAGQLSFDPTRAAELAANGVAVVLARESTAPEDVHGMVNAAAIVTTRGGVVSHAAVVARSWSIPAVTSLDGAAFADGGLLVGGTRLREGELVTVDGNRGLLFAGDCRDSQTVEVPWAQTIREWALELGVEPGVQAGAQASPPVEAAFELFDLLRTIELKGLCNAARAAAYLDASEDAVAAAIAAAGELLKETPRGFMLAPPARAWIAEALETQRAAVGGRLEECYADFSPLNLGFKQLVTWWQTAGKEEGEPGLARLTSELRALHEVFLPIVGRAASVAPRLAAFTGRFEAAVAAVAGGDASMLASPMKESYHTLWFDFHEELIALSGRSRADEET